MTTESDLWLGSLVEANHIFSKFRLASRFDGKSWTIIRAKNPPQPFPANGVVQGEPDPDLSKRDGTCWFFRCRLPSGSSTKWSMVERERAFPIVDLSRVTLSVARKSLCETGVDLPDGQGNQAVVRLADDLCAQLKFDHLDGKWFARLPPGGVVELRRSKFLDGVDEEGVKQYASFSSNTLDRELVSTIYWGNDADFLRMAVDRYRHSLVGFTGLSSTDEAIHKRLERELRQLGSSGEGVAELSSLVERLRHDWPDTTRALGGVKAFTELILESERGKQLLKTAVAERTREAIKEVEARAEAAAAEKYTRGRDELARLEATLVLKRSESASLEAALVDRRTELASLKGELAAVQTATMSARDLSDQAEVDLESSRVALETTAQDRLGQERLRDEVASELRTLEIRLNEFIEDARVAFETSAAPERSGVTELALRLQNALRKEVSDEPVFLPSALPPWSVPARRVCADIDVEELKGRLIVEAAHHGLVEDDLLLLDSFLRAGEPLLVTGPNADLCLRAYATAVSGGEVRIHALDPAAIGLDDLWTVPTSGRATSFALAWHRARVHPSETVLVCLRNLDAAPFRLWIASMQAVLDSAYRPRNLLVAACASIEADDGGMDKPLPDDPAKRLAALAPQLVPGATDADDVTEFDTREPTRLRWPLINPTAPLAAYAAIALPDREAQSVRRALRVAGVGITTRESMVRATASAWAGYLSTGDSSTLP